MQIMCFDLLGYSKDAAHATGQVDGFNTWNIALTAQLCYIWCLKTWTWITHIICISSSLLARGVPLEGFGTNSCWGRWELSFQFNTGVLPIFRASQKGPSLKLLWCRMNQDAMVANHTLPVLPCTNSLTGSMMAYRSIGSVLVKGFNSGFFSR